ncbi:hypothetical protein SALWKB29_1367 [Snodgrassella communis]|uniref:Uncharacterized protein n=1 Tax=Snodgrassella communis TaxID=2946699 RepID=A0A836MR24_9NEIS|nr:hypothetical protein SALWKB29_1367 [Snodgrassella communis]
MDNYIKCLWYYFIIGDNGGYQIRNDYTRLMQVVQIMYD